MKRISKYQYLVSSTPIVTERIHKKSITMAFLLGVKATSSRRGMGVLGAWCTWTLGNETFKPE